jgi:hypothetical protein
MNLNSVDNARPVKAVPTSLSTVSWLKSAPRNVHDQAVAVQSVRKLNMGPVSVWRARQFSKRDSSEYATALSYGRQWLPWRPIQFVRLLRRQRGWYAMCLDAII